MERDPPLRIEAAQCGQIKHCGKAHLMPFAQHGDMRADDPPAFGKTHPALRLPSRCRCPDPLEFGVGGCDIRPETGDDRFQQAARKTVVEGMRWEDCYGSGVRTRL